jgi:molybdopterin molybdotransferase
MTSSTKHPTKPPMKTAEEALAHLLAQATAVDPIEVLDTSDALGRVLAQDMLSQVDVPPMDNTQMDGYAVRSADVSHAGVSLKVSQRIPAGHLGQALEPGTIARIFTGATIPDGADAIVMQEVCEVNGDLVTIQEIPESGQWIRRQGEDLKAGHVCLSKGTLLRAQELGVLASAGYAKLPVFRKLKVAAFFTGDELTLPGQPLKPGSIYNSNRDTLLACIRSLGCEATDLGIVPDTLEATRDALRRASDGHDLIITSGGVSVGEEDHIKPAVTAEGRLDMWQIAIKPGKPLAFGAVKKQHPQTAEASETWFMGLPGNPVSSFVTFLLFVRPFIAKLQGRKNFATPTMSIRADFDWVKPDRRNEFLRVRMNDKGGLDLFPNQSSGVLTSASWADGLVDNPASQVIKKGDFVKYMPFSGML